MDLAAMRTELSARGFSHLSATRLDLLINRARARLDGMHTWSYREDSAQGVAPLIVSTMGLVEAVGNESQDYPLEEIGYADLVGWGCDLDETGTPQYWYHSQPAGVKVINTWPTSSDTIGVQFWRRTAVLVADADEPLSPEDYHLLYVDMAQQQAERDRGNHPAAQALQPEIDRQVAEMVEDLLPQQEPKHMKVSGWNSEDW